MVKNSERVYFFKYAVSSSLLGSFLYSFYPYYCLVLYIPVTNCFIKLKKDLLCIYVCNLLHPNMYLLSVCIADAK